MSTANISYPEHRTCVIVLCLAVIIRKFCHKITKSLFDFYILLAEKGHCEYITVTLETFSYVLLVTKKFIA